MSHQVISDLLANGPLYKKVLIDSKYSYQGFLEDITFDFICNNEKAKKTFKLLAEPEKVRNNMHDLESFLSDTQLEFFQQYKGECQSCSNYAVHFLLHVFSEGEYHKIAHDRYKPRFTEVGTTNSPHLKDTGKLFLRKVGQWPSTEIKPNPIINSFLEKEGSDFYKKAMVCISQSYGIGAFAYIRRIVEMETIRIIEMLARVDSDDANKIKELIADFYVTKQMAPLIENIYPYLPATLRELDDNPFKLLWKLLSEGLHAHSDEECLKYAEALDRLLIYTIRKIREDQGELREIKDIMANLRK